MEQVHGKNYLVVSTKKKKKDVQLESCELVLFGAKWRL